MTDRRRKPRAAYVLPEAISSDITGVVPASLGPIRRVASVWPAAVGAALARYATPARIAGDGTLIVHATDASWVHAITLESRTIVKRLAEHLGDDAPTSLRVELGVVYQAPEEEQPSQQTILPAALARAEAIVVDVVDDRLRESLRRAIAASLSRDP